MYRAPCIDAGQSRKRQTAACRVIAAVVASDLEALGGAIGEIDTRAVD